MSVESRNTNMIDRRTVLSAIAASFALPVPSPAKAATGSAPGRLALYANVGPNLTHYGVDVEAMTLTKRDTITLPDSVQYAWPHCSRRFLYVATSNTAPGNGAVPGNSHHLVALKIEEKNGALTAHGVPLAIPTRPIHVSTDIPSENILVAFNKPSGVRVYRINEDFTPAEEVSQTGPIDPGIYAHQVRVTPDNKLAILVTRGNEGTPTHIEEPGAIKVFDYERGLLSNEISIAPDGGRNFGPRHLDFHPTLPLIFLSIETQNQVALLRMDDARIEPDLLFRTGTLAKRGSRRARQAAGACAPKWQISLRCEPGGTNRGVQGFSRGTRMASWSTRSTRGPASPAPFNILGHAESIRVLSTSTRVVECWWPSTTFPSQCATVTG
ncbi:lactonase family protein [Bradyrhizobium cenepequi]|uniref:lactonase family protein n=1 Tax=Bradyrhizobium cenepequi TaxID=2821403 RepID=UPI00201C156C|nr:beta-propeller fold lactonase family protein [Bradyrhizobium cenepequi]MCA6108566.1 beta-propeller fold lactonase family protein [Bradyrhizobium cenepequi]